MSDARLRDLERRYKETGSVEDEAVYWQEAVRTGVLAPQKLECAADLGYPPAREALGLGPLEELTLAAHGNHLRQRWGQWELVCASHAVTLRLLPEEEPPLSAAMIAARDALDAVAAWIKSPQTTREVWRLQRQLSHEELVAWAGEPVAGAIRETLYAVTRPPSRGSPSTRGCEALAYAASVLGFDAMLGVLAEEVVPRVLAVNT